MSTLSGVPIEPAEQTRLLDACSAVPGVLGGGVPGGRSLHPSTFNLGLVLKLCFDVSVKAWIEIWIHD